MQPQELPAPKRGSQRRERMFPGPEPGCSRSLRGNPALDRGTAAAAEPRGAGAAESPARPLLVSPPSPPSPGCPTEWDGVSCWPALPLGQSRAVACPDILNVFKKSQGLNPAGIAHPMGPARPARDPCATPALPSDPTAPASPKQMPLV